MRHQNRFLAMSFALAGVLAASSMSYIFAQEMQQTPEQHEQSEDENHGFKGEFKAFHDVLHPLQHEALPKNDMKTIRAKASELYTVGMKIARMKTPAGIGSPVEYRRGLTKFRRALTSYRSYARKGSDAKLKTAYEQVHDTFEELAAMLPR